MQWSAIDNGVWRRDDFIDLSAEGRSLWLAAWTYSGEHNTDGRLSEGTVRLLCRGWQIPKEAIEELVTAGLFTGDEDGYQVVDFVTLNPSSEARSERARKAAHVRWHGKDTDDDGSREDASSMLGASGQNGARMPVAMPVQSERNAQPCYIDTYSNSNNNSNNVEETIRLVGTAQRDVTDPFGRLSLAREVMSIIHETITEPGERSALLLFDEFLAEEGANGMIEAALDYRRWQDSLKPSRRKKDQLAAFRNQLKMRRAKRLKYGQPAPAQAGQPMAMNPMMQRLRERVDRDARGGADG